MRLLILIIILTTTLQLSSQNINVVNFNNLEPYLSTESDTVFVVNFWATWCKPCVEELPGFFKLEEELKNEKFKLLLVSLDFASHIEQRVKPFIKKNKITTEVVVLDDPDANIWINKVNPDWDGSIPITLIFNKKYSKFIDSTIEYEELKEEVEKIK